MVQLSTSWRPGPLASVLGILSALFSLSIGVALLQRSETAFGAVWSAFFMVSGLIILVSYGVLAVAARRPAPPAREVVLQGEPARFLARRTRRTAPSILAVGLLGGWFLVMGVVGAIEENWLWPVLAAFPAIYFLGIPVLAVMGRFRSGGVWLTPTRVVNEEHGLRTEIALAEVHEVLPHRAAVRIVPVDESAVHHRRLTPRMWCASVTPGKMIIPTEGVAGGSDGLAAEVRDRAGAARDRR